MLRLLKCNEIQDNMLFTNHYLQSVVIWEDLNEKNKSINVAVGRGDVHQILVIKGVIRTGTLTYLVDDL